MCVKLKYPRMLRMVVVIGVQEGGEILIICQVEALGI